MKKEIKKCRRKNDIRLTNQSMGHESVKKGGVGRDKKLAMLTSTLKEKE